MSKTTPSIMMIILLLSFGLLSGCAGDLFPNIASERSTPTETDATTEQTSHTVNKKPIEISSTKPKKTGNTSVQKEGPFDPQSPQLANIAMTDSKKRVLNLLGEPLDQYTMQDDDGPIEVLLYNGISVGFHPQKGIIFIEVSKHDIATGLAGIRVEQPVTTVIHALGKPNTETEFMISYEAADALLKMDIDPVTQEVQSIKLFRT